MRGKIKNNEGHNYEGKKEKKKRRPEPLIRCMYGSFGREITKYTVIYGVYVRFWPTLCMYIRFWPTLLLRHDRHELRLLSSVLCSLISLFVSIVGLGMVMFVANMARCHLPYKANELQIYRSIAINQGYPESACTRSIYSICSTEIIQTYALSTYEF